MRQLAAGALTCAMAAAAAVHPSASADQQPPPGGPAGATARGAAPATPQAALGGRSAGRRGLRGRRHAPDHRQHVTRETPPTFLFHTTADTGVPAENSVRFYLALKKAGVPAEMHVFENGPHGVGLALGDPALGAWPTLLTNWLRARGLLTPSGGVRS